MPRDPVGWAPDAAGHPSPDALAAEGVPFVAQYVGTAYQHYGVSRGYIDECHARGVGVVLIFEEWSSQFLTGYGGAVASCARMMQGWDELGAPRDGSVIPHIALVDPTPSAVYGAEGVLQDYARGWDDALPFPAWRGYGSKYGLDLAHQVTRKQLNNWGVGTWGFGEAGNGALPPWTSDAADMIQHGNVGAPIPGTDYNTLFTASMGAWGGPSGAPPKKRKRKRMDSFFVLELYTNSIWVVDPNTSTRAWIREWDQFLAQVQYRRIINYLAGEKVVDDELHRSDEKVGDIEGFWGKLWSHCRDVDEFNDVGTGGGGGGGGAGGATPAQVEVIVKESEARVLTDVNKARTLQ